MFERRARVIVAVWLWCVVTGVRAGAQSRIEPGEIVNGYTNVAFDTRSRAYDYLVDGSLAQHDPARRTFRTVEAAYDAAPAGTPERPTVIGIRPNVYMLPGKDTTPGLIITKPNITLLGLTHDRRNVVLADNRGNQQGAGALGASNNGFTMVVKADGFSAVNLTVLNYCNIDYEYPGDPTKNLQRRSDVITQAVALQSEGDRHVYSHVALVSRLDTWFLSTTRAYLTHVYVEGTDDFIGGGQISLWEDSEIRTYSPKGILFARGAVFTRTVFKAVEGMTFYKVIGEPIAVIECVLPVSTSKARVAWMGWTVPQRENTYSLTYRSTHADGTPAVLPDGLSDPATFRLSREISNREARAFNAWNLLHATPAGVDDGWDPAGVRATWEHQPLGEQVFRLALVNGNPSVRTGGPGAVIEARVAPQRARGVPITWTTSSPLVRLSATTGERVTVTAHSAADRGEWVDVQAMAPNGFYATAHVYVEPAFKAPPTFVRTPVVSWVAGRAVVDYALDLGLHDDQSDVTWAICETAACTSPTVVAVSRAPQPARSFALVPGMVGHFVRVTIRPRHNVSDAGPEVVAVSARAVARGDLAVGPVALEARTFVVSPTGPDRNGLWNVKGAWHVAEHERCVGGYGVYGSSPDAAIVYQRNEPVERMSIRLVVTPDKATGQSFSGPGSADDQHAAMNADVFIKYDPVTKTGYSLRVWRTTLSAVKVMMQFLRHVNGVSTPLSPEQVLTGVWKPNATLTVSVDGPLITANARNDTDSEVLLMRGTIEPNGFGGAGVRWPGSAGVNSRNLFSVIEVTYPGDPGR